MPDACGFLLWGAVACNALAAAWCGWQGWRYSRTRERLTTLYEGLYWQTLAKMLDGEE